MMCCPIRSLRRRRAAAGFNLIEVLIALAIFTIGFVTVGALLPVALNEQRWAMDDTMAQELARTARDTLRGKKFHVTNSGIWPGLTETNKFNNTCKFQVLDSAYLSQYYDPKDCSSPNFSFTGNGGTGQVNWSDRRFYWFALARCAKTPVSSPPSKQPADWQVCVWVVRREVGETVGSIMTPSWGLATFTYAAPTTRINFSSGSNSFTINTVPMLKVSAGDMVVDDLGDVLKAVNADSSGFNVVGTIAPHYDSTGVVIPPTGVWFCQPQSAGKPGPTMSIMMISDAVEPGS